MTAERWCPVHSEPLLDLVCAHQHDWINHADGRQTPNYEVTSWLLVVDGIVAAECDGERTRWLRQPFDGGTRKLSGRLENGTGGRAWSLDMQQIRGEEHMSEARRASRRAQSERRRVTPKPIVIAEEEAEA